MLRNALQIDDTKGTKAHGASKLRGLDNERRVLFDWRWPHDQQVESNQCRGAAGGRVEQRLLSNRHALVSQVQRGRQEDWRARPLRSRRLRRPLLHHEQEWQDREERGRAQGEILFTLLKNIWNTFRFFILYFSKWYKTTEVATLSDTTSLILSLRFKQYESLRNNDNLIETN